MVNNLLVRRRFLVQAFSFFLFLGTSSISFSATLGGAPKKAPPKESAKEVSTSSSALPSKIESVRQKVDIKSAGTNKWQKAKSNMPLAKSDQIRTGSRSVARVKLGDGSKVLILQNSQAEVENLSTLEKTIKLLKGRVRAIVSKIKGGNNFKITTPVGVASVRGTDFEVEFSEETQSMEVSVREGQVGVSKLGDLASEVILNAGERLNFGAEGEMGDPIKAGAIPLNRMDIQSEVQVSQVKDAVLASAAEEQRNADYQVGKSIIDVNGKRVRIEEYITRPAANQFKLVVLNERSNRFDYFTYKGTFNHPGKNER